MLRLPGSRGILYRYPIMGSNYYLFKSQKMKFNWKKLILDIARLLIAAAAGAIGSTTNIL